MKPGNNAHEKFEWDMTVVLLLLLLIMFGVVMVLAFAPFGHRV